MSMTTQQSQHRSERLLRAEAAAWVAKLHGPERSAELEADFRAWLSIGPRNAAAFERATEVWDSLRNVNLGGVPRMVSTRARRSRAQPRLAQLAAACVVTCVVGIAWWLLRAPSYSTDIGEQRVVTLADGSRLSLNSRTQADIEYDEQQRVVRLKKGEAYFEVAKNPHRPFIVIAGPRTITAVGTSFVVRHEDGTVTVTLAEGKVTVASSDETSSEAPPAPILHLQPGERVQVQGSEQRVDTPPPQSIAAWRRGEVELDYTRLQEAVEEMNRYDRTRLVIVEPEIGELRISGMYRIGKNRDFARALAVVHGLNITEGEGELQLSRR